MDSDLVQHVNPQDLLGCCSAPCGPPAKRQRLNQSSHDVKEATVLTSKIWEDSSCSASCEDLDHFFTAAWPCSGDGDCTIDNQCWDPTCEGTPCFDAECNSPACTLETCPDNKCHNEVCAQSCEPCDCNLSPFIQDEWLERPYSESYESDPTADARHRHPFLTAEKFEKEQHPDVQISPSLLSAASVADFQLTDPGFSQLQAATGLANLQQAPTLLTGMGLETFYQPPSAFTFQAALVDPSQQQPNGKIHNTVSVSLSNNETDESTPSLASSPITPNSAELFGREELATPRSRGKRPYPASDRPLLLKMESSDRIGGGKDKSSHTCFWLCGAEVCGAKCKSSKDLHDHIVKEHVEPLKSQHVCQWKGCSNKTDFRQRSKLSRHTQTHAGRKSLLGIPISLAKYN
jgi:hypothetical protein